MGKRRIISNIYLMLGLLGEILIFGGFLLLTPNGKSDVAWLNWVVVSFIFGLNYFSSDILFPPTEEFSNRIPALGPRIVTGVSYTLFAIVWIILGYYLKWDFRIQLLGHLIMVFMVILGYTVAHKASKYAAQVESSEKAQELILTAAKNELKLLCTVFDKELAKDSPKYKLRTFSEELRFISPANNNETRELETKILELIRQIKSILPSELNNMGNSNEDSLNRSVESLGLLIKQRKALRM